MMTAHAIYANLAQKVRLGVAFVAIFALGATNALQADEVATPKATTKTTKSTTNGGGGSPNLKIANLPKTPKNTTI